MADRLFMGVLGHRNSGKSRTWNDLFGGTVRTGKYPRMLELRSGECVEVFLISGSNEERHEYAGDVLGNQTARIVLCSMQYIETVVDTIKYIEDEQFWIYVQWLNPGYSDLDQQYSDYLGIANRLLYNSEAVLAVRSGKDDPANRIREIKEIHLWLGEVSQSDRALPVSRCLIPRGCALPCGIRSATESSLTEPSH